MQESRLFKIVYHLLEHGQATAVQLAERFEVSVRTIYRDIDALSEAGIPVYAEPGRNGGVHLMNDFVLDKAVLSAEEKQEILTALQSIQSVQNPDDRRTLHKLSALFELNTESWLEVDFSRWGNEASDSEKFELLKSAVIHQKCVKIAYANSNGASGERIIQPLKLSYKSAAWYVKAFCTTKQDYRIFKLNRIMRLEVLEESFDRRTFPEQSADAIPETAAVTLRFPPDMAYRVLDEFDPTKISRQQDGSLIVSTSLPHDDWLIGYLLSFGTQVEILSPASLRGLVAERAKKIYEKHKP